MSSLERLAAADEEIRSQAEDTIATILRHDLADVPTDDLVDAAVALMRHRELE